MKKIAVIMIGMSLLATGGCLSRTYYFEPSEKTLTKGKDGQVRGAIKETGYYSWWSDAPGKNFANPSFSIIGK